MLSSERANSGCNLTEANNILFVDVINADANTIINCIDAKINATGETHVNSPRIKLGEAAAESVVKGDTFKSLFDSHVHPAPGGVTGTPLPPFKNSTYLSTKNTTD